MKKVILSTLAAAALATTASAEIKVGVGVDVMTSITNLPASKTTHQQTMSAASTIGSAPVVRIAIDGLVSGLRIEPRIAYAKSENPQNDVVSTGNPISVAMTSIGLGAYYNLTDLISVAVAYDSLSATMNGYGGQTTKSDSKYTGRKMGVGLKAETEIAKGFTIASEFGLESSSMKGDYTGAKEVTDIAPYTSVTFRYFF